MSARRGRFCSHQCEYAWRRGRPQVGFVTPKSSQAERVRANGLINKRLNLGWFRKPKRCQKCAREARLDSDHPDYKKPAVVFWLCRSCHMRAHHDRDFLRGIKPMDTDVFDPRRPTARPPIAEGGGA